MGLLLKLKPKQRANWKIFFKHALEIYQADQFIGVPFGTGGYGYVGNPFSRVIHEHLHKYSGLSTNFRPILLVKSLKILDSLIPLTSVQRKIALNLWPGNLIFGFSAEDLPSEPPITTPQFHLNESVQISIQDLLSRLFLLSSPPHLFVQIPPHPIAQDLFSFLEDQNLPPIMIGFLVENAPGVPVVDAESLLNEFADRNLGVILSGSKLQKGNYPLPPTIITGSVPESIKILHPGLISQQTLEESYLPQINSHSDNEEQEEGGKLDGL